MSKKRGQMFTTGHILEIRHKIITIQGSRTSFPGAMCPTGFGYIMEFHHKGGVLWWVSNYSNQKIQPLLWRVLTYERKGSHGGLPPRSADDTLPAIRSRRRRGRKATRASRRRRDDRGYRIFDGRYQKSTTYHDAKVAHGWDTQKHTFQSRISSKSLFVWRVGDYISVDPGVSNHRQSWIKTEILIWREEGIDRTVDPGFPKDVSCKPYSIFE